MLTLDQLQRICREAPASTLRHFVEPLNQIFQRSEYQLTTRAAQLYFLANAAHETQQFTAMKEKLNYSAERLLQVFPKYFDGITATSYAGKPELIGSRVYANRMGNGDEASREGFLYCGRGIPHITGKDNYRKLSIAICGDADTLLVNPELLEDPDYAVTSGAWYWAENNLGQLADAGNFDAVCDIIWRGRMTPAIGDSNGYGDRVGFLRRAESVLK